MVVLSVSLFRFTDALIGTVGIDGCVSHRGHWTRTQISCMLQFNFTVGLEFVQSFDWLFMVSLEVF